MRFCKIHRYKGAERENRKSKVISLEMKIQILGETVTRVSNTYSIHEATIRTIRKNEDSIRKCVAAGTEGSMSTTFYVRNNEIEKMVKALMIKHKSEYQLTPMQTP